MKSTLDTLRGLNAYPIPQSTLEEVAVRRGLLLDGEATREVVNSKDYKLATADVLMWLATAPSVSQGGQSYSFNDNQRKLFTNRANAIYEAFGERQSMTKPTYGYKGSRL